MSLSRLWPYVRRHSKHLAISTAAILGASVAAIASPLLARAAVNAAIAGRVSELLLPATGIVALACVRGLLGFVGSVSARRLAELVALDLRVELYRKLQELSLSYIFREGAGRLVARVTSDVEEVKRLFAFGLAAFAGNTLLIILSLAAMLSISPPLTGIVLAVLAPLAPIVKRLAGRIRRGFRRARRIYANMSSTLREIVVGMASLRGVSAEEYAEARFRRDNDEYARTMIEVERLRALALPTLSAVTLGSLLAVYWAGGLAVASGQLTVGDVVAFAMYATMLSWPVSSLGLLVTFIETARAAASRVFEVLDAKPAVSEKPGAIPLRVQRGEVRFENVWFSYDGKRWVLKGLNLTVKPGELVAITGPPGSGKTTLAFLAIRLFDPQRGRVLIDGVDVRDVTLDSLRRQVAVVHQDVYLFPDTIRNNIAYAKPGASDEEVVRAAKLARIHDFIVSLPRGYDTPVGERGVTLSGGQRQRIALARALLADPKIIFLDDTTSEVDAETERAIMDALTKHFRGRTVIVVTQRPSVMALADRVVVVRDGRVVKEVARRR